MKMPRNVYGRRLADHLCKLWGYRKAHQTGSHIIIDTETPIPQRLSIPAHKPLKVGMLGGILKDVADHKQVSRDEVLRGL